MAFFVGPLAAQDTPLPDLALASMHEDESFRYARALFPIDADPADASAVHDLAPSDKELIRRTLAGRLAELVDVYRGNRASIHAMLRAEHVALPSSTTVDGPTALEILDGAQPTAAADDTGRIAVATVTLRGFLTGAVRAGVTENSGEGMMFRKALGWGQDLAGDDATWGRRIGSLLDLVERMQPTTVPAAVQMEAITAMLSEDDEQRSPSFFDSLVERSLRGREELGPVETYRLNAAMLYLTFFLHGSEERFLLAHELGHVVLRHSHRTDCAQSARQELDADAFAVALLTYDATVGFVDLVLFGDPATALDRVTYSGGDAEEPDLRRGKFGYVQAFRYGMASAGMRGDPNTVCPFVPAEDRLERTDAIQESITRRRFAAYATFNTYFHAKPAVVATLQTDGLLDSRAKAELADPVRAKCNGAAARLVRFAGQPALNQKPHVYHVKCGWPAPSLADVPEPDRILIGSEVYTWLEGMYSDLGQVESEPV